MLTNEFFLSAGVMSRDGYWWVPDYHEPIVEIFEPIVFLSGKNKPIGNANLSAGTWRLTMSVTLCRHCYFMPSCPFSVSLLALNWGSCDFS